MEAVKQELTEILLSLVKGVKVLVVYIIPSIVIAIIAVPDIAVVIQSKPETLLPYIINAVVLAIASYVAPKVERLTKEDNG
jgi:hypothetical protein